MTDDLHNKGPLNLVINSFTRFNLWIISTSEKTAFVFIQPWSTMTAELHAADHLLVSDPISMWTKHFLIAPNKQKAFNTATFSSLI